MEGLVTSAPPNEERPKKKLATVLSGAVRKGQLNSTFHTTGETKLSTSFLHIFRVYLFSF